MMADKPGAVRQVGDLLYVACGDGATMSVPAIDLDGSLGWKLRYNPPSELNNMAAASALESFAYLVDNCTKEEAWRRIKFLRKARQDYVS